METLGLTEVARIKEVSSTGVSWGAVIAGAFVAAALSLAMMALGAGMELSSISPWSNFGAASATAGAAAIIWLIVTQALASGMGGYLAGRLRTRWQSIHNDEVHFRDTANGLVTWAVAVVVTVAFLAGAATTMTGGTLVPRISRAAESTPGVSVLRPNSSLTPGPGSLEDQFARDMAREEQREEQIRKATAHLLLWTFVALFTGAFCASYAATIGGRQRDHVRAI